MEDPGEVEILEEDTDPRLRASTDPRLLRLALPAVFDISDAPTQLIALPGAEPSPWPTLLGALAVLLALGGACALFWQSKGAGVPFAAPAAQSPPLPETSRVETATPAAAPEPGADRPALDARIRALRAEAQRALEARERARAR